jgi:hypothetical protein
MARARRRRASAYSDWQVKAEAIERQETLDPISGGDGARRRRRGDLDAAAADPDEAADLEQPEPNGSTGRLRGLGVPEADAAQRAEQHRSDPQAWRS